MIDSRGIESYFFFGLLKISRMASSTPTPISPYPINLLSLKNTPARRNIKARLANGVSRFPLLPLLTKKNQEGNYRQNHNGHSNVDL